MSLAFARYLTGYAEQLNGKREKGIVAVEELLPSEAVTFNRRKVLAFFIEKRFPLLACRNPFA